MGFLSKLLKKAKPLLPFLIPMIGQGIMGSSALASALGTGGKLSKLGSFFGGMNPMMKNMLTQSALGYGTAALSGSKRPGKAAMYAGLASLPFSYMSASQAANAYNQKFAGEVPKIPGVTGRAPTMGGGSEYPFLSNLGGQKDVMGQVLTPDFAYKKMTPWDILRGSKVQTDKIIAEGAAKNAATRAADIGQDLPTADIFSKVSRGGKNYLGQQMAAPGTRTPDWIPTMASQAAALYGGQDTPEEKWDKARKRRRKELAWMYGVPEDMIEGEMTNPWASGSFWNRGGIASLENGGDVSGPGTGTSDSINANLSDGEFVMTAKAVENLGNGDRYAGARQMYDLMNVLDPESETMSEVI